MKVTIIQPQHLMFGEMKTGQVFKQDTGVYIKTCPGGAVCLHKMAGLMQQEGKLADFDGQTICVLVQEMTFTLGPK